jgi:hypothetical protein
MSKRPHHAHLRYLTAGRIIWHRGLNAARGPPGGYPYYRSQDYKSIKGWPNTVKDCWLEKEMWLLRAISHYRSLSITSSFIKWQLLRRFRDIETKNKLEWFMEMLLSWTRPASLWGETSNIRRLSWCWNYVTGKRRVLKPRTSYLY